VDNFGDNFEPSEKFTLERTRWEKIPWHLKFFGVLLLATLWLMTGFKLILMYIERSWK
jgi:hypothetical protein